MVGSGTRHISSVTSGEGVLLERERIVRFASDPGVAVNSLRRLFNKNTGLCKVENDV